MKRRGIPLPSNPATIRSSGFEEFRDDPIGFVRVVLGVEPWAVQQQILHALATQPRVSVRSCNGAGKTICAAWATLWFLYTRPGSIVITTAPTGQQVKNLLWRRLRDAFENARVPLPGRCLTGMLECGADWYALGLSTDKEVNFQGPHSAAGVLMVGDEASGLAEWMFSAMVGSMTEPGAKMLLIGNPNYPVGTFYDSQRLWPVEQRFHISAFDVPEHVLRPGWKEECLRDWGADSPLYQVRVLGEFPDQGEDAVIAASWIENARAASLETVGDIEIGVDLARMGGDECVAYIRQGPTVLRGVYWRGTDLVHSTGQIAALCSEYDPAVCKIDCIGLGAGPTDFLTDQDPRVVGLNVGLAAWDSEHYANRRSEIFWGLRDRFRDGDITIPADDSLLADQLAALRFSYTPRGQIKLVSKEDMKKLRQGNHHWTSPDRADALAIAYAQAEAFTPGVVVGEGRGWSS